MRGAEVVWNFVACERDGESSRERGWFYMR